MRSREVLAYRSFGAFSVGKTPRCAYQRAVQSVSEHVTALNSAKSQAEYLAAYESLGGSA